MTSTDTQALRDDVAFLRNLVTGSEQWLAVFGEGYFAAGLIYGTQMLLHAAQLTGLAPAGGLLSLAVGIGPTLIFIPVVVWINWRHRRQAPPSPAGRAVTAVFGVAGLSNLGLVAVIGSVAWREQSLTTWLIYPCAVFIFQGAAWWVAYCLRRKAWLAWVGAGWFVTGIAMAFSVTAMAYYILYAAVGIWVLMALPGWVMMRGGRASAQA
jgi:hypothetical protein